LILELLLIISTQSVSRIRMFPLSISIPRVFTFRGGVAKDTTGETILWQVLILEVKPLRRITTLREDSNSSP
jgi:hypothetical protein